MDLAFLKFPDEFNANDLKQLTAWTEYSVKNAKHIFAISESTKNDLIAYYQIPAEKITVTYLGINISSQKSYDSVLKKYKINPPYIIFVGTLQPRKNLVNLIKAYERVIKIDPNQNLKLVIVGKKGWLYRDIFKIVQDLKLTEKVIFTDYIAEIDKQILIKQAWALVLPSFYEGFGLPVVEAMAQGTPTIISENSSLLEIGQDATVFIKSPFGIKQIQTSLLKMLQLSSHDHKKLIQTGLDKARQFSWQICGQLTLNTLLNFKAYV